MKNYLCFIVFTLIFYCGASTQNIEEEDTVVVFKVSPPNNFGSFVKYRYYKKGFIINWTDSQNLAHKSEIYAINPDYLVLGSDTVRPSEIKGLFNAPSKIIIPKSFQIPAWLITDSSQTFNVMTYFDFIVLNKIKTINEAHQRKDPFYKNISTEDYVAELKKIKWRREARQAALDTCPLRYGLSTNLVKDVTNEINLNVELPIKRNFVVEVGAGVLYSKPNVSRYDYAEFLTSISYFMGHYYNFDHSFSIRKGFTLEVIPKFFLSAKKHIYMGPQLAFGYFYYNDKWIFLHSEGRDYYLTETYGFQSEKSASVQLNALFGVQTPQIKRFLFNAFVSIGVKYRGGVVSRNIKKTHYSFGSRTEYIDPQFEYKGGEFLISAQIGFKMGWRFGKAKLYKQKP